MTDKVFWNTYFWESVQRQALEVELIYHSSLGKSIRDSSAYDQLVQVMTELKLAQLELPTYVRRELTTSSALSWYLSERKQQRERTTISYEIYRSALPSQTQASQHSPESDKARWVARLEKLKSQLMMGQREIPQGYLVDCVTSKTWSKEPREIKVATQELQPGEISEVFSLEGNPLLVRVVAVAESDPTSSEMLPGILAQYEQEIRRRYWLKFAGLPIPN